MFYNSDKWFILLRKYRTASFISGLIFVSVLMLTLPYSLAPFMQIGTVICLTVIFLEWVLFPTVEFLRYNVAFKLLPKKLQLLTYLFGLSLVGATVSLCASFYFVTTHYAWISALFLVFSCLCAYTISTQGKHLLQQQQQLLNDEYDIRRESHDLQFHTYYRNIFLYALLVWYCVTATSALAFVNIFMVVGFFGHLALNCLTVSNRWFYVWGPLWGVSYTLGLYFMISQQFYTRMSVRDVIVLALLFGVTTVLFSVFRRYKQQLVEQKLLLYPLQMNLSASQA